MYFFLYTSHIIQNDLTLPYLPLPIHHVWRAPNCITVEHNVTGKMCLPRKILIVWPLRVATAPAKV